MIPMIVFVVLTLLASLPAAINAGTMQMNAITLNAVWPARQESGIQIYPRSLTFNRASDNAVVTWQPNFLMMWGGNRNDVWISSDSARTWEIISGTGSRASTSSYLRDGPRSADCYNKLTGEMFVNAGRFNGAYSSNTSYSADGISWTFNGQQIFWPRERAPCIVDNNGNLYITGGLTHVNNVVTADNSNDIWMTAASSTRGGSGWTLVTRNAPWFKRQGHQLAQHYNEYLKTDVLYLMNGFVSGRYNDIWVSTNQMRNWHRLNAMAQYGGRMDSQTTNTKNGVMIVAAGDCGGTCNKNDVWASLDGGYTWGECCQNCSYNVREDHVQIVDPSGTFLLLSGSQENPGLGLANDIWASTLNFNDAGAVARTCGLQTPTCGGIGLRCLPDGFCQCSPYGKKFEMKSVNKNPGWSPRFEGGIGQYPKALSFQHADTGSRVNLPAGSLIMWGGRGAYNDNSVLNDVWASSNGDMWYLIGGQANGNGVHAASRGNAIQDMARTADCYDEKTGKLYSIAGTRNGDRTSAVQMSADGGLSWRQLNDGQFPVREASACAVDSRGRIFLFGGQGTGSVRYNDVWMSQNGNSWVRQAANAPWDARTQLDGDIYYSPAFKTDLLYMANGYQPAPPTNRVNDVWVSSSSGVTWARVTANAPYAGRQDGQLLFTSTGAMVVVAGDVGVNEPGNLNDIWASLDGGYSWGTCNMTAGFYPREDHVAIFTASGHLLVTQGEAPNTPLDNQVWRSQLAFTDSNIASNCGVKIPSCGVGLRCWPLATGGPSKSCRCGSYGESSTGGGEWPDNDGGDGNVSTGDSSSGLSTGAIVLIVLVVIVVVALAGWYVKTHLMSSNKPTSDYQPSDNQMTQVLTTDGDSAKY